MANDDRPPTSDKTASVRTFAKDKLLMLLAALGVVFIGSAAFAIAELRGINPAFVFAVGFAAVFIASVGRSFREKFASRLFQMFFATWVIIHVIISLLLVAYISLAYWFLIYCAELAIGYLLAVRLFGPIRDPHKNG